MAIVYGARKREDSVMGWRCYNTSGSMILLMLCGMLYGRAQNGKYRRRYAEDGRDRCVEKGSIAS